MPSVEEGLGREIQLGDTGQKKSAASSTGLLDATAAFRLKRALESENVTRYESPESLALEKIALDEQLMASVEDPGLRDLIQSILRGEEPLDRPLHPWEPKKFNAAHINVILMRAAGFKPGELAEMLGYDRSRISVILGHPYAVRLLAFILPMAAKSALNTRARLDSYASRMLDKVYQIGLDTDDEQVATRIGFGLIDRSSYAPTRFAEVHHKHTLSAPAASINRLTDALAESQSFAIDAEYQVISAPPVGDGDAAKGGSSTSLVSDGLARSSNEPPIGNPPSQEEAA